jgi:hypothetical protein
MAGRIVNSTMHAQAISALLQDGVRIVPPFVRV